MLDDFYFEVGKAVSAVIVPGDGDDDETDETVDGLVLRISAIVMKRLHGTIWCQERAMNPNDQLY